MGQYHMVYNLDKREFIHAHDIDNGLKLMEQCGPCIDPTTSDAVWLLLANSNGRGGGDATEHPMVGRWAGDRLLVQGDYAEAEDTAYLPEEDREEYTNISYEVKKMLDVVFGTHNAGSKLTHAEQIDTGIAEAEKGMKWNIEYDNDTGKGGGFWEWWTVSDGERSYKCDSEEDAKWLCELLNREAGQVGC